MKEQGKTIVLTGDRPTGRLHLGHLVGSIQNRLKLQEEGHKCYYMVADIQALTDNFDNPEKVHDNVFEVVLDNLACGVDPNKTTFFIQSQIPEIAELTVLFMNLVTVQRLLRNPTVKNEIQQKGYKLLEDTSSSGDESAGIPSGFLSYPISQAADILTFKSNLVPVGEDQLPVLEQANEIIEKFNRIYGETFQKIKPILSSNVRLVGIDGQAKMSKSLNNAIYLSDERDEIEKKVMQMYTDPTHIRKEDPGKVEGNVVFTYLDIFDDRKDEVASLKAEYQKGGLGDVEIKKRLIEVLDTLIAPIREKRQELAKNKEQIIEILKSGTAKAKESAQTTLEEVKSKIKIQYF